MRIAIISDHRGSAWAGCEELWSAMAGRALDSGHTVAVFLCRHDVPESRIKPLVSRGMKLHLPPRTGTALVNHARRISWKAGNAISNLADPFREIGRFSPDVVFYNAGDQLPDSAVLDNLRQSRALDRPYAVMCHNSHFFDHPPVGAYRDSVVGFYQGARVVLAPAKRTLFEIEHILAARLKQTRILKNPVNLKDTSAVPMPANSPVGIATIGRIFIRQKGQDILPAALASPALRQKEWRLAYYGEGPDADYLSHLARHYGISDRVHIKGYAGDIRKVWAENHILALPSRFESAPLVVVEAMLCGRPCVVNDVGGVTDWIREPETGFVSPGLSVGSFQSALERAWAAQSDWAAIGMRAHQEAQNLIDADPGGSLLSLLTDLGQEAVEVERGSGIQIKP